MFVEDSPEFSQILQIRSVWNDNVVLFAALFCCRGALAGSFCCFDKGLLAQDLSAFLMCFMLFLLSLPLTRKDQWFER